jgi:hydroxymethylglutaryl-CoA lyase
MAGTEDVWRLVHKHADTRYSALVLNQRGLDQAVAAGVPHLEIYVSASETHSERNVGMSVQRALSEACSMIDKALSAGLGVTAGVMCAFGCFYEGPIPVSKIVDLVRTLDRAPEVEIGLADTTGMADGRAIREVLRALRGNVGPDRIAMHLHDTRGEGLANVQASLELEVRRFDTAVGGLGGCPFIPGAAGNIATERTVMMMEGQGISTGVDLAALALVRELLAGNLGKRLPTS